MNMDKFTKQALEAATKITGKPVTDTETQEVAFKLACAMMAEELAARQGLLMAAMLSLCSAGTSFANWALSGII